MIVVFDLETTGTFTARDRVVQIGAVKVDENFTEQDRFVQLIDPCTSIPPAATAIHRIRDEDVRNCPKFEDVADDIIEFFGDCDVGGFNVLSFDIPLLNAEMERCGRTLDLTGRRIFDAYSVFRRYEKRDLASAYRMYCHEEIGEGAHDALVDTLATVSIIESQLTYYQSHKDKIDGLDDLARASVADRVTIDGKIVWDDDDEAALAFGKNKGKTLKWHIQYEPKYLRWILAGGFSDEVKDIVKRAIEGDFPKREDYARGREPEESATD